MVSGYSLKNSQIISPEVFSFFLIIFKSMCELTQEYLSQLLNEEYKIWKKQVPFLYNVLNCYELPTNSNTVSWLPSRALFEDQTGVQAKLLLGTNSTDKNSLLTANIALPTAETLCDMSEYKADAQVGQLGLRKLDISSALPQNSQVLRARVNPKHDSLVACKVGGYEPDLLVYDLQECAGKQNPEPLARLEGHTTEGFGLDWNSQAPNLLLSGSLDRKICIWDIERESEHRAKPINQYHFHSTGIEDVNWSKLSTDIFASCGQDRLIAIWDLRERKKKPECQKTGHTGEVYTLDFCPDSEVLFLSGGEDGQIGLWDMRNITKRIHTFIGHSDSINRVSWCPTKRLIFASASNDRRCIIWDVSKCGNNSEYEDAGQIVFIHGGHRSRVLDLDWSQEGEIIASTEQGGNVQVWRMAGSMESEGPNPQCQ